MKAPNYLWLKKCAFGLVILLAIFQLFSPAFLFREKMVVNAGDTEVGEASLLSTTISLETKRTTTETTKEVKQTVWERLYKGLLLSASITVRNALVYLSQKMAEQTLDWVATGEWGQGGMFYEQAWNKFTSDIMNYTVGQMLDNLRDVVWSETGFDICEPRTPDIKIKIMIGLELPNVDDPGMIEQQQPDCSLSKLVNNWEALYDNTVAKYKQFLDKPGAMSLAFLQEATDASFDMKYTDMGQWIKMNQEIMAEQQKLKEAEGKQREEAGGGMKATTSVEGTTVKTPPEANTEVTKEDIRQTKGMQKSEGQQSLDVITEIPESVVAAFVNSFVSKAFSEAFLKKLWDGITKSPKGYQPRAGIFEDKEQIAKEMAQAIQVQKVSFSTSSKQIDLLTQFTSCPQDRQIYNCVVDNDFAQAVRSADQDKPLSLKEAIASGKVNGNLPLIPPTDGRNQSSNCYEEGWCYSNLVKLRTARIIPIGWEIAARKVEEGENITLKYAMEQFSTAGDRFEKLIDPEWILRAPLARCEAEAFGPTLIGAGSDKRAPVCADLKTCIKQDETGKCKAWGYCAAEQNVFRFGGTECSAQYDSCRTVTKVEGGEKASYLVNTVDTTGCDPNNAGCKVYSTIRNSAANWDWKLPDDDTCGGASCTYDSIQLNKNIKDFECSPNDEGCTRFVRTYAGSGTSLIENGGFEIFTGDINSPDLNDNEAQGWWNKVDLPADVGIELVSDSFAGLAALSLASGEDVYMKPQFSLPAKDHVRYFAVSAKAKKKTAEANVTFEWKTLLADVFQTDSKFRGEELENGKADLSSAPLDSWVTVYQIIKIQPDYAATADFDIYSIQITAVGGEVLLDNVVFEEIDRPSLAALHDYSDYGAQNALYLKQAPGYLLCYDVKTGVPGRPATNADINTQNDATTTPNSKGCDGFAKLCSAEDVGCEKYTLTVGSSYVTGVTSFADYCPQECNGYDTFRQDKSFLDSGYFPEYFIPATAKQCTVKDVGCEEFTNMEDLALGKESKAYFSEIRMCAPLPEKKEECSNFYTWEAKGTTGYQLQAYYLLDENDDGIPDTSGTPDNLVCNKDIFESGLNPNCRAFYNDGGSVYYREYSKTITCSTDCHPYRRTLKYEEYDENGDGTIQPTETPDGRCIARQGRWVNNECIFMTIPSESKVCSAEVAACKAYKGNAAGNEQIIYNVPFLTGDLDKFVTDETVAHIETLPEGQVGAMQKLTAKPEQLNLAEGEYVLNFWLKEKDATGAEVAVQLALDGVEKVKDTITQADLVSASTNALPWKLFSYNFKVSTSEAFGDVVLIISSADEKYIDNLQVRQVEDVHYLIKNSWSTPDSCNRDLFDAPLNQAQVGCKEYKDRVGTTHYLKSFSGLCASDKVGCEALIDTRNSVYPYESFIKEQVPNEVVCSVYPTDGKNYTGEKSIDTANKICRYVYIDKGVEKTNEVPMAVLCSGNLGVAFGRGQSYTWNTDKGVCEVTVGRNSADNLIYLVNDEKMSCKNSAKGCMALGKPNYKISNNVQAVDTWDTNFYRIDPDVFGSLKSPVCPTYALSCDEYKDGTGTTMFFKDPRAKLCEWRKGNIGQQDVAEAWFVKGVEGDVLCGGYLPGNYGLYKDNMLSDYNRDEVRHPVKASDPKYRGWAATCPGEQDKCTAFIDPTDDANGDGFGRAYYYLNNERIDRTCTSVSRKNGCLLFNDTSNPQLTANADLSYASSGQQMPGNPANPSDTNALIKVVRDRECGAWYDCITSHPTWDPAQNRYVDVCDKVSVCNKLMISSELDSPVCEVFLTSELPNNENILTSNVPMEVRYTQRPVGWANLDYSGYSIPLSAPVHFYNAYDIDESEKDDYRLVNFSNMTGAAGMCKQDSNCMSFCEQAGDMPDVDDPEFKKYCRCLNGRCVRANPLIAKEFSTAPSPSCRAYPSDNAPFPNSVNGAQAFLNAKTMYSDGVEIDKYRDYACSYVEKVYGGGSVVKFVPTQHSAVLNTEGFCQELPDKPCNCTDDSPGLNGKDVVVKTEKSCSSETCAATGAKYGLCMRQSEEDLNKQKSYLGWQGYCLEEDLSIAKNNNQDEHPCLTWYPSDSLAGLQDLKNNYEEAGYYSSGEKGSLFTTDVAGWNKKLGVTTADHPNSAEETPYVRTIDHIGSDYVNWTFWMHTGTDGYNSYQEYFSPSKGNKNIYLNDLKGILVECGPPGTMHSDWCAPGRRYSTEDNGFYAVSKKFSPPEGLPAGFYIPVAGLDSSPNGQDAPAADYKAHVKMRKLSDDNYTFHGVSADDQVKFGNYQYIQVVWDEGAAVQANCHNNWSWGGQDKVLVKNSEPDHGWEGKSPLFIGTGYNHEEGTCIDIITGKEIPSIAGQPNVCNGSGIAAKQVDTAAYKTNPQCQQTEGCQKWSSVECSTDNDCGNPQKVGEVGVWDLEGTWQPNVKGSCVTIGSGKYCSNVRCNYQPEGEEQHPLCKDSNATWMCDADEGADYGYCMNSQPPKNQLAPDASGNYSSFIVGYCDAVAHSCDKRNNYWGLRLVFDGNGKYLGPWLSQCDESKNRGWQDLKIHFVFKEYSTELAQVNYQGQFGSTNAAYTNKIYQASKNNKIIKQTSESGSVRFDSQLSPMGSAGKESPGGQMLIPAKIGTTNEAGAPYVEPGGSPWVDNSNYGGKPYGCSKGETQNCNGNKDEYDEGTKTFEYLHQYFAKIYKRWVWDPVAKIYNQFNDSGMNKTGIANDKHVIPIVAAVTKTNRVDSNGKPIYGATPGRITVNGREYGTIEHLSNTFEAVVKFYAWAGDDQMPISKVTVDWGVPGNTVPLSGKFKNHKPRCQHEKNQELRLCNAATYAGKGLIAPSGTIYGFACYLDEECAHLPGTKEEKTCLDEALADRFGDISKGDYSNADFGKGISSCQESYFQFDNLYTCNGQGDLKICDQQITENGITYTPITNCWVPNYKEGKGACRFRPGVQVVDNWGWCNGDTTWNYTDKNSPMISSMSIGSQSCLGENMQEFYDGFIYLVP